MVLSHRNHGNFSKKLTCFLNSNQKEKLKCQDFSEKYSRSEERENMLSFLSLIQMFLGCDLQLLLYAKRYRFITKGDNSVTNTEKKSLITMSLQKSMVQSRQRPSHA